MIAFAGVFAFAFPIVVLLLGLWWLRAVALAAQDLERATKELAASMARLVESSGQELPEEADPSWPSAEHEEPSE